MPPRPHHSHESPLYGSIHYQPPFPTVKDLEILEELLGSADEARAMSRILTSCPPEIAALASLNLRLFNRMQVSLND